MWVTTRKLVPLALLTSRISSKTVDTYKQRINEKLGFAGRPAYVHFALRLGLLVAGMSRGVAHARSP